MPLLVIDKPVGPTSFQVVHRIRRLLAERAGRPARSLRVGHGGTLDPEASGVLPVGVGEGTKLAPFLLDADKRYQATVEFGIETDTLDAAGKVVARRPVEGLDRERLEVLLAQFRGPQQQIPPMYSALKRDGRPLHAYARAGQEVDRAPRSITIHELVLEAWIPPSAAQIRVWCSKGTYIRVLAADLGRAAGPGAHVRALRRTASGPFHLGQAVELAALEALVREGAPLPFVSLAEVLAHLPAVQVGPELELALSQGRRVPVTELVVPPAEPVELLLGRHRLLRNDGSLLAVANLAGSLVELLRVFARETPGEMPEKAPGDAKIATVGLTSPRFL
jgi:tRNA pseudouridine55 synthase